MSSQDIIALLYIVQFICQCKFSVYVDMVPPVVVKAPYINIIREPLAKDKGEVT